VLCPKCREVDTTSQTAALKQRIESLREATIYRPVGCAECRTTGYSGRHAIFELMDLSSEIREMILRDCSAGQLRDVARKKGMRTLSDDGWRLVQKGITSPDEVLRVTKDQTLDDNLVI